jgi:amidase
MEDLTVAKAHEGFKSGSITSHDLVSYYLKRIEALDNAGPKLNSILSISSTALEEAMTLDQHLKETGELKGPLHGIPIAIKDQAATAGLRTTYGSAAAKDYIPKEDATLVKKLREAGAIILAKTTMPDWATSWHSTSSVSGLTGNPYDPARDPGGSSSGTGAAVAADLALLGVGEDTGGSIRLPASFCGLVGLRPTPGMISRYGMSPLVVPQDTPGPMCRTVADTALMFDSMVGFDEKDSYTTANAIAGPPRGGSYTSGLEGADLSGLRIGVVRELFGADSDEKAAPVTQIINAALSKLESAGTKLVDVSIPNLLGYFSETFLYALRSKSDLNAFFASHPDPTISKLTVDGLGSSKNFHQALDLLTDITNGPESPHKSDGEFSRKMQAQAEFQRVVLSTMARNNVSLLAFPDCRIPAQLNTDVLRPPWGGAAGFPTNTLLASQAILPAISVPAGLTDDLGLPVGLELVGPPYSEQRLLEAAACVERVVQGRVPPRL